MKIGGLPGPGALAHYLLKSLAEKPFDSAQAKPGRILVVLSEESELEDLGDALKALSPLHPGMPAEAAYVAETPMSWPAALERLRAGARVLLATPEVLQLPFPGPEQYERSRWTLAYGQDVGRTELTRKLEGFGYSRVEYAEAPGEYAARGQVVDLYLPEPVAAYRLLFSGDRIESIRKYDPETQKSEGFLDAVTVLPIKAEDEAAPSTRSRGEGGGGGLLSWLGEDGLILFRSSLELPKTSLARAELTDAGTPGSVDAGLRSHPKFQGNLEMVAAEIRKEHAAGFKVLLYGLNRGEEFRLIELLEPKIPDGSAEFTVGPLGEGFIDPAGKLSVFTSGEIFQRSYRVRTLAPWKAPKPAGRYGWSDLKTGDYVVHKRYGIAKYLGLTPAQEMGDLLPEELGHLPARQQAGFQQQAQDCLLLEFRGGDKVYVPLYDFAAVQKYIGAEGKRPRLSALDSATWEGVQLKAAEGVAELAREILRREAARQALGGTAFPADSHLEQEFAESFPYEETPDQKKAIDATLRDLMAPAPMDRVVVGDVGFGKTEVAMRAALKVVLAGKQVVVLVPTTLLADQHFRTFSERFADYPVRVALLSRFLGPAEQQAVLRQAAKGGCDIVVGTHRLLQKDVKFKDIGLIVVDEEHRFGVKDKERLRALKAHADSLSLSATPIPRTLYTAMSGLRSISLIETAPQGRQAVNTLVAPYSDDLVVRSIHKELERGGQVFYVYNHVKNLPERVKALQEKCPGVRFLMAHGQMPSGQLEKAMWDFLHRKFDVMVASTIVESGLDIPSVNTLIVEDAHEFGLAQLYQIRGRVGRERAKAHCLLLYPAAFGNFELLSDDAKKRLSALREFSALGSGFRLALRDLEIRGAGDLLGAKQHGFLNSVGLEYYCNLLNAEMEKLKGKAAAVEAPVVLDLRAPAGIPEDYLPGELDRIEFYKRFLNARGDAELAAVAAELEDLSGPAPRPVRTLLQILRLKLRATRAGLKSVAERGDGVLEVTLRPGAALESDQMEALTRQYQGKLRYFSGAEGDGFRVTIGGRDPVEWLEDFLSALK